MSFSYFQTFSLVSISLGKQELFSLTWNFILSSRETHQDFLTSLYDVYAIVCFVKFISAVKITLWIFRQIEGESMDASDERETRLFPDKGTQGRITCCALTAEFLIYATDVSGFQDFCVMPCHSLQNDGFMANSRFTNKKVLAHMPVKSTKCSISTPSVSPIPCWAAFFSILVLFSERETCPGLVVDFNKGHEVSHFACRWTRPLLVTRNTDKI